MRALIGLSGLYCAGKNHIAGLLEERGFPALDVDKLGHAALEAERASVAALFGDGVLGEGGGIDRQALGRLVFADAGKRAALEAIVHPAVNRLIDQWLDERKDARACVINAALLHKCAAFERLSFILWVRSPYPLRLLRARRRDRLGWLEAAARLASQKDFFLNYSRRLADMIFIDNWGISGCTSALRKQLESILTARGLD